MTRKGKTKEQTRPRVESKGVCTIAVDPTRIRFQHSRIRPYFSGCGRSVMETLESIRKGEIQAKDLPAIQVSFCSCLRLFTAHINGVLNLLHRRLSGDPTTRKEDHGIIHSTIVVFGCSRNAEKRDSFRTIKSQFAFAHPRVQPRPVDIPCRIAPWRLPSCARDNGRKARYFYRSSCYPGRMKQ